MNNKLFCEQVLALLSFYLDDKLNYKLKESIEEHLRECDTCRDVYSTAGALIYWQVPVFKKTYNLHNNLSAYIDNELSDEDAIKIRKLAITNPNARKDLENMYLLRKELIDSFSKYKNECKTDYSKIIIDLVKGKKRQFEFGKLIWTFTAMMSAIVAGCIAMLYF